VNSPDYHKERLRGALYGRRKGHPLTERQQHLVDTALPALRVDLDISDPASLFPTHKSAYRLEIGFGGGEHLLHRAQTHPDIGFIGCEPFVNGVAKLLAGIEEAQLTNIRIHDNDASLLLDVLPAHMFEKIYLLYPDPWPKKRHWKRRFINQENLTRLARALKPGGEFLFASDIDSYVDWTLWHIGRHGGFTWTARRSVDWQRPYDGWPGTRYEDKAKREGRRPAYLTFERK
jgi:tRNA (guanine-N7-)-methyltransferase